MSISENFDLIENYVHVCNEALLQNKDRFPFKQILGAVREAQMGCVVEVNISDIPSAESFIFHLKDDGLVAKPHGSCADCACDREWNVSKDYLECVAADPKSYIQNPAKINWEWMYDVQS